MTPAEAAECAVASVPRLSAPRPEALVGFPEVADLVDAVGDRKNRATWAATFTACKELYRANTND